MEDPALALILEECLALLDAGEEVDVIVGRFPDFSDTLEPLLRVAANLYDGAADVVEVPREALKDIGEFLQTRVQDLTD
jgi:hypothetical protein